MLSNITDASMVRNVLGSPYLHVCHVNIYAKKW